MRAAISEITEHPLFRAAIFAPIGILLIFSFFNLSAAPDQNRIAQAITLGVVNHDTGMTFPPIKISNRIMEGMAENLPFSVRDFDEDADARAALEAGEISAALIFPANFSKNTSSGDPIEVTVLNSQHLSLIESQLGGQLPILLQSALSAAVATVRYSLSQGQLPTGGFPVIAKVETLYTATNGAALVAPFVMGFAIWLAAMVGPMMMFFATKNAGNARATAMMRTVSPVIISLLATFGLTIVVCWTSGNWGIFGGLWLNAWLVLLVLSWLMAGLFAVLNMFAMLILVPMVFYQAAVGGAQAPVAAAPNWLRSIGETIPFDAVGEVFRNAVIGGSAPFPTMLLLVTAAIGLVLIWAGSLIIGPKK